MIMRLLIEIIAQQNLVKVFRPLPIFAHRRIELFHQNHMIGGCKHSQNDVFNQCCLTQFDVVWHVTVRGRHSSNIIQNGGLNFQ